MWENQFRLGTAKLQMRMNPNEFGKKLGIGVRVAGRIAQQRAQEAARARSAAQQAQGTLGPEMSSTGTATSQSASARTVYEQVPRSVPSSRDVQQMKDKTHRLTRAAGRGVGGFLRPFGRIGGILWLEVTGFFFGLFGFYFAIDMWRNRLGYAAGPLHTRFLISAGLMVVFGYLCISAFWRAQRR